MLLRLLTYNVWFEYESTYGPRMAAIAKMANVAADVPADDSPRPAALGLQELTFAQAADVRPRLIQAGYHILEQPAPEVGYWCALATRAPLGPMRDQRWQPYVCGSMMCRGLVFATCALGAGSVVIGTTHLESFIGEEHRARVGQLRRAQLTEATRTLKAAAEKAGAFGAILMGDLNWADDENGNPLSLAGSGWVDAWEAAGSPSGARYTYDGRENPMLASRFQSRLDRVLIWTPSALERCDVALIGKKKLGALTVGKTTRNGMTRTLPLMPSDHFGLLATVSFAGGSRADDPALQRRETAVKPSDDGLRRERQRESGGGTHVHGATGSSANPIELD